MTFSTDLKILTFYQQTYQQFLENNDFFVQTEA